MLDAFLGNAWKLVSNQYLLGIASGVAAKVAGDLIMDHFRDRKAARKSRDAERKATEERAKYDRIMKAAGEAAERHMAEEEAKEAEQAKIREREELRSAYIASMLPAQEQDDV